ncbi:hypothetical protein ASPWEDRAFT_175335 [Aspergillus wentii DTO 134E9]|uniref:Uncharacterized protein n=1 Tax=Aspergillus wentii DTO 134E9 TaxID=1073089 RepID=A0A1L9RAT6_ASPWE|nr:uncharacterized protein ASPWEDRAFT_175335 [Aspergillus wentii DTO 134E9]KAI9934606.1 hypothetical protein MW887_000222 [Aspergillus wentii]OJJ32029.1 hypothetical protein ASPWEDRAFT_175335 [Aspergillus wentii DTO 134E9]
MSKPTNTTTPSHILVLILTLSITLSLLLLVLVLTPSSIVSINYSPICPQSSSIPQTHDHSPQNDHAHNNEIIHRPFNEDPDLERITPDATHPNLDWETLLIPPTGGTILAKTTANTIPDAETVVDGEVYGISMYNQLHCLLVIRGLVFPETSQKKVNSTSESRLHGGGHEHGDRAHWAHCFDYIAQAIICAADDAIEQPIIENGVKTHNIDGIGAVHQCRDARVLWEASSTTWENPLDMSSWKGEGVRSFLGDKFRGKVDPHDMSPLYSLGVEDP